MNEQWSVDGRSIGIVGRLHRKQKDEQISCFQHVKFQDAICFKGKCAQSASETGMFAIFVAPHSPF